MIDFSAILHRFRAALIIGTLAALSPASAATLAVSCPSQSINGAIASFFAGGGRAPSLDKLTLRVSGTCTENVFIPPLREVELIGVSRPILRPSIQVEPVLRVQGRGLIRGFRVTSSGVVGFPSGLIQVGPYGYLRVEGSTVSSSTARILVQAFHTSELEIRNSVIDGGARTAVEISNNAHAFIYAENGGTTLIRSPGGSGFRASIGCYQANLTIWAIGAAARIFIGPSETGIDSENCTARIGGFDEEAGLVRFLGATNAGINAESGDSYTIYQTVFSGNPGAAVQLTSGSMRIGTSTISNNGSGIHANSGATIDFQNSSGPSTVSQSVNPYNCYQGGHIYADSGDITGAVSDYCLTIGEPD